MITLVVIINISTSLALFYTAMRMWMLKHKLAKIANWFANADRSTFALLRDVPIGIYTGQQKIYNLRQRRELLEAQILQLQQIFGLVLLVLQTWRRYGRRLSNPLKKQ
jgi:hypothetical protein